MRVFRCFVGFSLLPLAAFLAFMPCHEIAVFTDLLELFFHHSGELMHELQGLAPLLGLIRQHACPGEETMSHVRQRASRRHTMAIIMVAAVACLPVLAAFLTLLAPINVANHPQKAVSNRYGPPKVLATSGNTDYKPLVVSWEKIDSLTGEHIGGSAWSFTLEDKPEINTWCVADSVAGQSVPPLNCETAGYGRDLVDSDDRAGFLCIENLPKGVYSIRETTVPSGYEIPQEDRNGYRLDLHKDRSFAITSLSEDNSVIDNKITNDEKRGIATWEKADSSNLSKFLTGSEWELTGEREWTDEHGARHTQSLTYSVSDNAGSSDADCHPSEPAGTAPGRLCDADPAPGRFSLSNLPWGRYTLRETQAPPTYVISHETPSGVIGKENGTFNAALDFGTIGNQKRQYALPVTGGNPALPWSIALAGTGFLVAGIFIFHRCSARKSGLTQSNTSTSA